MTRFLTEHEFERELEAIAHSSRSQLAGMWQEATKSLPPKGMSMALLRRALAYELQVQRWGGLDQKVARQLRRAADQGKAGVDHRQRRLRPGDRLVRQWNGREHVVDVLDRGFEWGGRRYGSLSAVARAITGARWSGPRFFGLGEG